MTLAGGEKRSLEAFLERHGELLRGFAQRLCPKKLGIEPAEIEQEARIRMWRTFARETALESPASYLYRVTAAAAIDAVRRRRARREDPLDPPDGRAPVYPRDARGNPESDLARAELRARIGRCVDALAEPRQRAVRLHLLGFGLAEIAGLSGWTEAKARNLVYRGLADLRERLAEEGVTQGVD